MALDYRSIMSGQRKDPLAVLMRGGLRLASIPYSVAIAIRNRRYDRGKTQIHHADVPVISVGNVTTGGTGKTPIVCFLAKWFRQRGCRVAIVSRGYGRGQADSNDEAMELHDRLPDVPHVQDVDRVEAARIAVEELDSQVILMDDGFQHRRLNRDLDLVVIDATCPFGYGHLLPRGLLREPLSGLRRADLILLTRCGLVDGPRLTQVEQTVRKYNRDAPLIRCQHRPAFLLEYPERTIDLTALQESPVAVISAIGNPAAFEQTLRSCGARITAARHLPDHDPYDPATVQQLRQWIESLGDQIQQVVCTHKDLVKLRTDRLGGKPLRSLMIEMTVDQNLDALDGALQELVEKIQSAQTTDPSE